MPSRHFLPSPPGFTGWSAFPLCAILGTYTTRTVPDSSTSPSGFCLSRTVEPEVDSAHGQVGVICPIPHRGIFQRSYDRNSSRSDVERQGCLYASVRRGAGLAGSLHLGHQERTQAVDLM